MAIAVFDPVAFKARYGEFAAVSNDTLSALFNEAGLYLSNTDSSVVQDVARRAIILYMLVAHLATLYGVAGAGGTRPVGRLSQATEGSISASFDGPPAGSFYWFQQTQYGASFLQATLQYRSFVYVPG
jgi:hypothetical protein